MAGSALFTKASAADRRLARRTFVHHPTAGLQKSLRKIVSGRPGQQNVSRMMRGITSPEVRDLMDKLAHGRVTKYGKKDEQSDQLNRLLGLLGPIGDVIRSTLAQGSTRNYTQSAFDAALDLIRAMGGEAMVQRGHAGYARGLAAAQELLQSAGYQIARPGEAKSEDQGEREWGNKAATDWLVQSEVKVSSSNVYSYAFAQETENFGTLYVTFLAWHPGMKKASSAAGATYAYYGVSLQQYRSFSREAAASAGGAVWDYLRTRGSISGHQHPYELVGGTLVTRQEIYIPRKVTEEGYFRRSVQVPHRGRGTWQRSSLPSREFLPNRGEPNRGESNRGAPNRGRG
jgi:hypothetical protein